MDFVVVETTREYCSLGNFILILFTLRFKITIALPDGWILSYAKTLAGAPFIVWNLKSPAFNAGVSLLVKSLSLFGVSWREISDGGVWNLSRGYGGMYAVGYGAWACVS